MTSEIQQKSPPDGTSRMWDFITGAKTGAELEVKIEHLGVHLGIELKDGERLRAKLAQIAAVCADNAGPECNAHMALHFVHQIATTHAYPVNTHKR